MTEPRTAKGKRGIIAAILTLIMAVSFAVPVFAAATTGEFFFRSHNGDGSNYLNTWTSGTPKQGDEIKLHAYTGDNSQKWKVFYQSTDGYYSLRCMSNTALAINRRTGTEGTAILWTWANGKTDSNCNAYNSGSSYYFYLVAHKQYLIASGTGSGAAVKFGSISGNNYKWWKR